MCNINLTSIQKQKVESYVHSNQNTLPPNLSLNVFELSTENFTFQLNSILRANLNSLNIERFLSDFDNAFNQYPNPEQITVYRVCNYQEMLCNLMNNTYIDFGYMSTSKRVESTQRFYQAPAFGYFPAFLTINIPAGVHILDLDKINDFDNTTYESEILIKRKARFNILINQEVASIGLGEIMGRENINLHQSIRCIELDFIAYLQ